MSKLMLYAQTPGSSQKYLKSFTRFFQPTKHQPFNQKDFCMNNPKKAVDSNLIDPSKAKTLEDLKARSTGATRTSSTISMLWV